MTGAVLLTTPRLVLRDFTADDAALLVDLDSDPAVMRYITGGPATPRDEIVDEILPAWIAMNLRSPGYGFWAAHLRTTDEFLGWFHLRPEPGPQADPELGYRLRSSSWGNGYGTEGSMALVSSAFADPRVRRVWAATMAVNAASRRVMEKVGMQMVRTFVADWPHRVPGEELGDVEYAITRAEWTARQS
jgi:RimJ/RimL family protein N-acetyltransferase